MTRNAKTIDRTVGWAVFLVSYALVLGLVLAPFPQHAPEKQRAISHDQVAVLVADGK